jgi:uncharacterized protein involved in exopolysaccharide biosynthesis
MWRHKKKALTCFLLVTAATIAAASLLPRRYHSEGSLLVRLGKENATLDRTATMSQDTVVAVPTSRENELNSVVDILHGRTIAEKVVDALGPAFILTDGAAPENGRATGAAYWASRCRRAAGDLASAGKDLLRRLGGVAALSDRDRAVIALREQYEVAPVHKSDVIRIECQGPSPQWSQTVMAKFLEIYVEEHIRLHRTNGSLQFFTEQAARSRQELAKKEEALRDLKTATGLASPVDQRQALVGRLARVEDDLMQAEAAHRVSESRIQVLRKQLGELPSQYVESRVSGIGNEGTDQVRSHLYELQIKKAAAAAKYTDSHPLLAEINAQLRDSRAAAEREEPTRTHVTTSKNRLHVETELALLQEEPVLVSLQGKTEVLHSQLAAVGGQLKTLNENEMQITKLARDIELLQGTYGKYAANLEQARIDDALETQRMSNISVVEPATWEPEPAFPRMRGVLACSLLAGCLAAVSVALLAQRRDHSFHTPADVQERLGLPVLTSIPRMEEKRVSANGNGERVKA